jgi:hypothetical protein
LGNSSSDLSSELIAHSNSQIVMAKGTRTSSPAKNHLRKLAIMWRLLMLKLAQWRVPMSLQLLAQDLLPLTE